MKAQEHINHFSPILTRFLENEIRLGNEIVETFKGWPDEGTIIIILKQPFIENYQDEDVEYKNIVDSHYWKEEYFDKTTNHILACRFF